LNLKNRVNFSLWCDFIEREFLDGEFREFIKSGNINGATSNPAIFEAAFKNSSAYKDDLKKFAHLSKKDRYEKMALFDIKKASKVLFDLYNQNADSGFISIEVDPNLCDDAKATIEEGSRIYSEIGSPNVMIKIPATNQGYIAMRELTSRGINVNATLIFSPTQAYESAKALNEGSIESNAQSVVSIFVSRFDKRLDETLSQNGLDKAKFGIMNAIKCYNEVHSFKNRNIKPLFASTGVKDKSLKKDYYITNLLLKNCVNTAPLDAIYEFIKSSNHKDIEAISNEELNEYFNTVSKIVNLDEIYEELLTQGLDAFKVSFENMLNLD
jgi:transaldolase